MFPQELAGLNITLQTELDAAAAKAREEEALKAKEEADAAEEKVATFAYVILEVSDYILLNLIGELCHIAHMSYAMAICQI